MLFLLQFHMFKCLLQIILHYKSQNTSIYLCLHISMFRSSKMLSLICGIKKENFFYIQKSTCERMGHRNWLLMTHYNKSTQVLRKILWCQLVLTPQQSFSRNISRQVKMFLLINQVFLFWPKQIWLMCGK